VEYQEAQQRAQAIMRQLKEFLSRRLMEHGDEITGHCELKGVPVQPTLMCRPKRLAFLLKQDQSEIVGALNAMRIIGRNVGGFSIGFIDGRSNIDFHEEISSVTAIP
jgi:hypothetical protein